jgi:hypothetical protein
MSRVLATFQRDTGQHVAGLHLLARLNRENGVDRQQVAGFAATGELGTGALLP